MINNSRIHLIISLSILALSLILQGCAQKEWGDPLAINDIEQEIFLTKLSKYHLSHCSTSPWDTDISMVLDTAFETKKANGYLSIIPPSLIKFVASNPLGQPIFAFVSDGNKVQILDVINRNITIGSSYSYAVRSDLPTAFISGDWGLWLSARLPKTLLQNPDLRSDRDDRGVWLSMPTKIKKNVQSHYLIDRNSLRIIEQIIIEEDEVIVRISYTGYDEQNECKYPKTVLIDKLPLGTNISIAFERNQQNEKINPQTFFISPPPGYMINNLP